MISIIIPAYNCFDYLQKCLDSIIKQEYTDWECILVDDGSSDGTLDLCKQYSAKDSRFKVYHKTNGGAASARKYGVNKAIGDWIFFSDSDDYIPPYALYNLINHDNGLTDIIAGTIKYEKTGAVYYTRKAEGNISKNSYILYLLEHSTYIGPCSKLIRRNLFFDLDWNIDNKITNFEDLLMLIALADKTQNDIIAVNSEIHYICITRPGSASSISMSYFGCKTLLESIWNILSKNYNDNKDILTAYFAFAIRLLKSMCINNHIWIPTDNFIKFLQSLDKQYRFNIPLKEKKTILSTIIRFIYFLRKFFK